jgi:hypothetical protein
MGGGTSVSDGNLDELLVSPLDDESARRNWWPLIVGVLVGAISVSGLFVLIGDDAAGDELPVAAPGSSVPSTTTTIPDEAPVVVEPSPFPRDYVAISDTEAVKPHHIFRSGDQIFVSMTTSYARGLDPVTEPLFLGGSWTLDTASGETIESDGTVFDDSSSGPNIVGSFSVVFTVPSDIDVQPERLRLVERWDPVEQTEFVRIPVDAWPYQLDEPLSLPFEGFSFRFDSLSSWQWVDAAWTIEGDSQTHRIVWIEVEMRGPDGSKIATAEPWIGPSRTFGFGDATEVDLLIIPGRVVFRTAEDVDAFYEDELGQTKELFVNVKVTVADPVPIDDVSFDLSDFPVQDA